MLSQVEENEEKSQKIALDTHTHVYAYTQICDGGPPSQIGLTEAWEIALSCVNTLSCVTCIVLHKLQGFYWVLLVVL